MELWWVQSNMRGMGDKFREVSMGGKGRCGLGVISDGKGRVSKKELGGK